MKKIVFCLLLLTFSFRLAAQIDYLEPVKPFSTYTGELGEYYRSVFSFYLIRASRNSLMRVLQLSLPFRRSMQCR